MYHTYFRYLFTAATLQALPLLATSLDATNPAAPVPPVQYESAIADYQAYRDEIVRDWRAVNDEVAGAGGHVGIMGGATGHGVHGDRKQATKPLTERSPAHGEPHVGGATRTPGSGAHQH
jgi:hypothetical protein